MTEMFQINYNSFRIVSFHGIIDGNWISVAVLV